MTDTLVVIFFGWPAILSSLALALAGILMRRHLLLPISAILIVLPSWYLSGYPAIGWIGLSLPLFLLGAAFAVRKERFQLAWVFMIPPFLISALLAYFVIYQ